jgi:hypothetical protein
MPPDTVARILKFVTQESKNWASALRTRELYHDNFTKNLSEISSISDFSCKIMDWPPY